jgi:hypothetical protein
MEQNHAPIGHPGAPIVVVRFDIFVGMPAIDMQQVNRCLRKMSQRLAKVRAYQPGECAVVRVIVCIDCFKDIRTVEPGMLIPQPRVDGVAARVHTEALNSLTEHRI